MDKTVRDIPLEMIEPNKFNPNVMSPECRASLKEDMKTTGPKHDLAIDRLIVSPKNVFYNSPEFDNEHFVIIDGKNRWEIAGEIGWPTIHCEIRCLGEELARIMCYRRNRERGTIDPILEAKLFQTEIDKGLTQDRIARAYTITRSHVANSLSLLKLDTKVVEVFRNPEETFKKIKQEEFNEQHQHWEERVNELEEEGHEVYIYEPTLDEKELVPRGTLSASHLETVAALPAERQVEVVTAVLENDLTVREAENRVRRIKGEIAEQKKLEEALKVAKRKKCPDCGGDPDRIDSNGRFHCGGSSCYKSWDPMKSQKQVDEEREAEMSEREKAESATRSEKVKKAKANPRYIRMAETPEELDALVAPWILRKVLQLTGIRNITVEGVRGTDKIEISYTGRSLSFSVTKKGEKHARKFNYDVEAKSYKIYDAKSRVNLGWDAMINEESREKTERFFREIVGTDVDPLKMPSRWTEEEGLTIE